MKTNDGFTLIEMVIFIVVASVGFLILSASYTQILKHNAVGEYISTASSLCEGKMEEIIATCSFDTIPDISPTAFDPPFDAYTYQVNWFYADSGNLNIDTGSPTEYKNVRITVNHNCIEPVYMTTILTDY
jgi:prepilin-type N-terminal cleavage/methylation domain-containing protein